jgi:hypothetical protein
MRAGHAFTYQGPFPWRCCLCPFPVRQGEQACCLWQGTRLMIAHEPGTCLRNRELVSTWMGAVAVSGIEPLAT